MNPSNRTDESPGGSPLALHVFEQHTRNWRENLYVYPVISRRSHGLSVGINLNPDKACNFDCIYCQVDRTTPPRTRELDLAILERELRDLLAMIADGRLLSDPAFAGVAEGYRELRDIAFSGDGEPTTSPFFLKAVQLVAQIKRELSLSRVKIVLITDACYLTQPNVAAGLEVMDQNQGEIWAKLDAGTEAYYKKINRPNKPLSHVMENIIATARARPVIIQSLFMRVKDEPPPESEITAYIGRLREITQRSGKIDRVQIYTIARRPAENNVTPLSRAEVDAIAVRTAESTGLKTEAYYSPPDY